MRFPYGIADFQKIREGEFLYVDRTDRIPLIEQAGEQLLFLRPRRFGKSLWLSILENYYDLAKAERFETLFGKLAIGKNPTSLHNQYFVLKLNFSVVEPSGDTNAIRQSLHQHINSCIHAFSIQYEKYLPRPIERITENSFSSLRNLLAAVATTGHKLYLLIDEYDNFANEVMISRLHRTNRYQELVEGEGVIKTFFKAIKEGAEGRGLDRVFITGVSPVVLSDVTSGYNVMENISFELDYHDLCGFTSAEIQNVLEQVANTCRFDSSQTKDVLNLMRTFYNGYRFGNETAELVYNPTLSFYFLKYFSRHCRYPEKMLDDNLAMDRNRIQYVAALPHGQNLVTQALAVSGSIPEQAIAIDQLADRFGVEAMLNAPRDHAFLVSLLYYFGVLTLAGRDDFGRLLFTIPNLVVRKLYAERLQESLLPNYEEQEQRQRAAMKFYAEGDLTFLCDLIEQHYFKVFDNRDLRWSNELVVKTAFLTLLFNDTYYIMDSEQSIERGYADLTLILRPDIRRYRLFDHVLEFKHLRWDDLGMKGDEGRKLSRAELRILPIVTARLADAKMQLGRYRQALENAYGERLKLRTHAVVCIGLERLVW